jgi:hypothetical protein
VESDILCESCGYMLNGLPPAGNCPECGTAMEFSISQALRTPSVWEDPDSRRGPVMRFLITSSQILISPSRFYRSLKSRGEVAPVRKFARIHYAIASLMLGLAAWFHWTWAEYMVRATAPPLWMRWGMLAALPIMTFISLMLVIRLAAQLTAWESAYRGYRLPHGVVLRALYYHAADLLPVSIVGLLTTGTFHFLRPDAVGMFGNVYLYVLSAEVVLSAIYLFITYWIGMTNLMYANR